MKRAMAVLLFGAVLTVLTFGVAPAFATGDHDCDHYRCYPTTSHTHETTTTTHVDTTTTAPETSTSVEATTTIFTTTTIPESSTTEPTPTTDPTTPELPRTGSSSGVLAMFGAVLLAAGVAFRSSSHQRRSFHG